MTWLPFATRHPELAGSRARLAAHRLLETGVDDDRRKPDAAPRRGHEAIERNSVLL
jgi:hypothetical protein